MIDAPLLDFLELKNRVPTHHEFRRLCVDRGISFQREARVLIDLFRRQGVFGPRMKPEHRQLLAVLTRTAGVRPALVVDNDGS
jgi:hypothetical protein